MKRQFSCLIVFEPVTLVADDEVDGQVVHELGGPDEHLVAHDEHRLPRVLRVLSDLRVLREKQPALVTPTVSSHVSKTDNEIGFLLQSGF
jgi:hypothetical protein